MRNSTEIPDYQISKISNYKQVLEIWQTIGHMLPRSWPKLRKIVQFWNALTQNVAKEGQKGAGNLDRLPRPLLLEFREAPIRQPSKFSRLRGPN